MRRLVAAAAFVALVDSASAQLVLPGIQHHWAGEGNANDSVGFDDGIVIGDVTYSSGVFGVAFDFNEGWVEFGNMAGNFGTSDFTIAFWVRTVMQDDAGLLDKRPICNTSNMIDMRKLGLHATYAAISDGSDTATALGSSLIDDGVWHHIGLRRAGVSLTVFFDGAPEDTVQSSVVINIGNEAPLQIGRSACNGTDGTMPFAGQFDDIQLYDRALTDGEITSLATVPPRCQADIDENNAVGVSDLLILLGFWGNCGAICLGDVNEDGQVGIEDLLILLGQWGPCK